MISGIASHSFKYTEREISQLNGLSQFGLELRQVRGSGNEVADALSRITINNLQFPSDIDYMELAATQRHQIARSSQRRNLTP